MHLFKERRAKITKFMEMTNLKHWFKMQICGVVIFIVLLEIKI